MGQHFGSIALQCMTVFLVFMCERSRFFPVCMSRLGTEKLKSFKLWLEN